MLYLKENFSIKTSTKLLSISDKTVKRVIVIKHEAYGYRDFNNQDYQRIFLYPAHYKVKNRFRS